MKILFIEPCFKNFGGYFRANGIAQALSEKKIGVDLLISSDKKFSLKIKKTRINDYFTRYELPRIYINFFITGRILRGIIACSFILFKKYDLIHFFALIQFESNIPFLFSKLLNRKSIIDWDDYWTDAHRIVPIYDNFLIKNYLKFCEYSIQKLANYGTATSDFLLKEFNKIGIKDNLKIVNGVDKYQFSPMSREKARGKLNISENEKIILTFGNTFFKERTVYLFKTFEKILEKDPDIKLYLNNDPLKMIREQAKGEEFNKNILKNIINIGRFKDEELSIYLGASDCILFPMGDSNLEKACFPTRIGTYLNGESIIITNNTSTEAGNVLKKYKCAIIGKDSDDLAVKTIQFFNNNILRDEKKENAKIAKKELLWEKLVDPLIDFYNKI